MQGVAVGAASLIGVSGSASATTQQSLEIQIDNPGSASEVWTEWVVDDMDPSDRITPAWKFGSSRSRLYRAQDLQMTSAGDKIAESGGARVTVYDAEGTEMWKYKDAQSDFLHTTVGTPDVVAVQTHHDVNGINEIMLLDADSGAELQNYYYYKDLLKSGAVDRQGGWMWLQTPGVTLKIDLESYDEVWTNHGDDSKDSTAVGGAILAYAPDRDVVLGVTEDASEIVISDAESGEEVKRSHLQIDLVGDNPLPGQAPAYSPESGLMWINTINSGSWVIDTTSETMSAQPADSRVLSDPAGNPVRIGVTDDLGVSLEWVESGYQAVAEGAVTNDVWGAAITESGVAVSTATDIQSEVIITEYLDLSSDWPVSIGARIVPDGSAGGEITRDVSGEIARGAVTDTLYTPVDLESGVESVLIDPSDATDAVLVGAGTFGGGGGGGGVVDNGSSLGLWGGLAGAGAAAVGGLFWRGSD